MSIQPPNEEARVTDALRSMSLTTVARACASCSKAETDTVKLRVCVACNNAPADFGVPHVQVYYCNKDCQVADRERHRKECQKLQKRKALYRAGALSRHIWYETHRQTYKYRVWDAQVVDGALRLQLGGPATTTRSGGIYYTFPDDIFADAFDKESALSMLSCSFSQALMFKATKWLFRNLCKTIEEVAVKIKHAPRHTQYSGPGHFESTESYLHELLRLTLASGEVYALDITGAQFGIERALMPWETYSQYLDGPDVEQSSTHGRLYELWMYRDTFRTTDNRNDLQEKTIADLLKINFNDEFERRVVAKQPKAIALLKCSAQEYQKSEEEILATVKKMSADIATKLDLMHQEITQQVTMARLRLHSWAYTRWEEGTVTEREVDLIEDLMGWLLQAYDRL